MDAVHLGCGTGVRLSETRDMDAAKAFFTQAVATVGFTPQTITTDKHASFPTAIAETLGKKVEHLCRTPGARHRSNHYLTNLIEQDHRGVKQRYYLMKTFKTMKSGSRFCSAFEEQRAYIRERHGKNVTWKPYMKRGMFKARFLKLRYELIAA